MLTKLEVSLVVGYLSYLSLIKYWTSREYVYMIWKKEKVCVSVKFSDYIWFL